MQNKPHYIKKESVVAAAVAKQLKLYLDIHRREESFDLTDPYIVGNLDTNSGIKVLRNNFFENVNQSNSKEKSIKQEIVLMENFPKLNEREQKLRLHIEQQMAQCTNMHVVSPYISAGLPQKKSLQKLEIRKLHRRRAMSARRVARRHAVVRNTPPQRITSAERERIVNLTTRLLVATESIALPQNRNQSQESQTSKEFIHVLPAVKKIQEMRPKTAYSDSERHYFSSEQSSNRTRSAENCSNYSDRVSARNNLFGIKRFNDSFAVSKNESLKFGRPKSSYSRPTKYCQPLKYSDEDFSDQITSSTNSLTDWSLLSQGRSKSDIATQTIKNRESKSSRFFHPAHSFRKENFSMNAQTALTQDKHKEKNAPKVLTYDVYIVTGDKLGAGTTANVKINISGEFGDTGDRLLIKSKTGITPFQRKQVDLFHLDSKFLGDLESIRIGHDSTSLADGWFLEKVIIQAESKAAFAFSFQCGRWFSAKEDDGQIVRDIVLTSKIPLSEIPEVSCQTKRKSFSRKVSSSDESNETVQKSFNTNNSHGSQKQILKSPVNSILNKPQMAVPKKETSNKSVALSQISRNSADHSKSSSSDSDSVLENQKLEKLKRRVKRFSRNSREEKLVTASPVSNFSGSINSLNSAKKISSNLLATSLKNSSAKPAQITDTSKVRKNTPIATLSLQNPPLLNTAKLVNTPKDIDTNNNILNSITNENHDVNYNDLSTNATKKTSINEDLSSNSTSSITTSSSDSESDKDQPILLPRKKSHESDEKVEFSHKDTLKLQLEQKDDGYMAGFTAGLKANKIKEEEAEKLMIEKEQFEKQLQRGSTVHQACEVGDIDRVKELISILPELKTKVDERGWAPIHISSAFGHLDLVKWFSVSGVDLMQETPTGYTSIHLAALNGHVNCIMILSAMGCPISCQTVDGHTPLHLASMSGHIECVKWLLSNRAKIDVKDSDDRTPYDLAVEYQHDECIQLLSIMNKELKRKDSVLSMLRDPTSLRKMSINCYESAGSIQHTKGADSGVGGESNEEWLSDSEDTNDVKGRGGDDRSEQVRKTSNTVGRKLSVGQKGPVARKTGLVNTRKLSKQEERQMEQLQEKKKIYEEQKTKILRKNSSFLDSIRQEIDGKEDDQYDF
ncbi:uncharacterized protein LOC100204458 isoform X3 [Hydra vulgaris]|uniref:uncharacterized protein LOC100204458 isoform X3 n=2 Tax=Hydra vulgaris TaxID=6087 RepID=UPI0032E9CA33